jgi:serine/threonine-protein kinase HipA
MAETRLFEGRFFGARRFDRTDQGKVHVVSAAGLVNADYRVPSLDYTSLMALTRRLTRDTAEVEQVYRRMVFNVAIGNRDDHAKNFAFMMDPAGRWRLAPAYDLLPSPGFNGFHTTTVNGTGRPGDEDLVAVGVRAGLRRRDAAGIVGQIRAVVSSGMAG